MSEKKIEIPKAMRKDADKKLHKVHDESYVAGFLAGMQYACEHLSENPIVTTEEQWVQLEKDCPFSFSTKKGLRWLIEQWQRRMFDAPEPEVPEEIENMQLIHLPSVKSQEELDRLVKKTQSEAYRRGKESGEENNRKCFEEAYYRGQKEAEFEIASIRREARKQALDEILAWARREKIDHMGVDTESTFYLAVQAWEQRQNNIDTKPKSADEFVECDACRSKPGCPPLCLGCLHNRDLIYRLKSSPQTK